MDSVTTKLSLVSMTCPNCAAAVKVAATTDTFVCSYCSSSLMVDRGAAVPELRRFEASMTKLERGTDRVSSELALVRLTKELEKVEYQLIVIKGKNEKETSRSVEARRAWEKEQQAKWSAQVTSRVYLVLMFGGTAATLLMFFWIDHNWQLLLGVAVCVSLFGLNIKSILAGPKSSASTEQQKTWQALTVDCADLEHSGSALREELIAHRAVLAK